MVRRGGEEDRDKFYRIRTLRLEVEVKTRDQS